MSCSTLAPGCVAARAGTASGTANNNNLFSMQYVDVDADATTFNSTRADLTLPAGVTVLFAGLYWGGESGASDALRRTVKLDTPAAGSYADVTGSALDTGTATPAAYQAFADVTLQVRTGGSGTYAVGNIQGTPASANQYAGWALVVVYAQAAAPRRNLAVFDGFQTMPSGGSLAIPLPGLTTPATGTVAASLGVVSWEGDRGTVGDGVRLGSTNLSDAQNPVDNAFNSTIGSGGTRFSAKQPDYVNQLGFDADVFGANGAIAPGSTSATLTLTSPVDVFRPGVVTLATDSEIDPPETTVSSGPSGVTGDSTPTFAFASDEPGSTFECRVDGGAWAACSSPFTTASLADGSHTFEVRATDAAANVDATPASRTFSVDTAPPQTTLGSGPTGPTGDSTPTFGFSSSEAGGTFECRVDGGAWAACSSPFTTASLADGSHTFEVRATDAAGNVDATPASRTFSVDTVPPQTAIESGPTGPTGDSTPTFGFSSSEAGGTFECRVDSGAWAACSSPFTTASLADGSHTFEVRATDAAGNVDATPAQRSVSVDTGAPQTTIDSGPSGQTGDPTPEFAFSSSEPGSSFECRIDGGAWAACSSPHATASLGDGSHTFEVRAADAAGNVDATPAARSFTVDTAPPQTTIDSGPAGPTGDLTPPFAFSSSELGSAFECRVDGGAWAACSSPHTTASLGDGAHTFEVRATDAAGNVDATPAARAFTVDTDAPQTTVDGGPSGPTGDSTPQFEFSSTEPGSAFECRVDGGAWAACTSPHTTASLGDGAHTFEVRATDAAGNVDATPASRTFTVDTGAPETTIDSGPAGPTADATPTFAFSSSEPGATFECRVDGGAWRSCSSPDTVPALADGAHTFEVRAVDAAGNVDATPAARAFTVDTDAPQTTIDGGPSGPTSDPTPTFEFSAEPGATFECRVDGGDWAACSSPHTTATLADGSHTFEVRAIDTAGNPDPTPAAHELTVDTAAPQTTIESGPSGPTGDSTPAFEFSSSEPGAAFECRVDGGDWAACSSPHTTASLDDGSHTFEVRAVDAAGNVDATPASRAFTVDTGAAQTTIDSGPSGPTADPTPTFEFAADDPGSTFECRVDGGAWEACTSPHTTAALGDGAHTFEVRATDAAGNLDPSPASQAFTVDTAAPQTAIDSGPAGPTGDSTPAFAFSADEPAATFECRIDDGDWAACSSPHTTAALGDGPHTFEVRAADAAGNVDASPASRSFSVDSDEPQTTIEGGPSGPTSDATPAFEFASDEPGSSFECRVDDGDWGPCSSPHTTPSLGDGEHAFEVRAVDAAANVDQTPASRSFTVDTGVPETTIESGPAGPTNDTTPEFAFSAGEPGASFECRVDGGAWAPCTSPETLASLEEGAHTFEVRAIDAAGNADATPASSSFTVDTDEPQTMIDSGPSESTNDSTPTFGVSSDEPGSSFECRVDGGDWAACSSPHTTASLGDGSHTFEVRAIDAAGNVDPTPASLAFTVDTEAPQTAIDGGPAGLTGDATPEFAFSAGEHGSSFECRVDGGDWAACSSPHTTASLGDGEHAFEVRAIDAAGNPDPSPASRAFTVDTGAPDTTIDAGPSGPTNDTTPAFEFSSSEPGSSFECRVDGGDWASCSSPHTTTSLGDGEHAFEVRGIDAAGNVDPTPASRAFAVDTEAPQTTIGSGPSGPTNDATPAFEFASGEQGTFECRVDGGAWASCASPHTTASLSDGAHTFEVRAIDAAGNPDATPAARSFMVDTEAPQTTIDTGPSGPTGDATPAFEFSASEPGSSFECRVDGGEWAACSSPHTTAPLADGAHTLEVRAIDAAGNVDANPAGRAFTVDTAAPQATIDAGPSGPTNDTTPVFTFSSGDPGATFECRVDGGDWAACTSPHTTAPLTEGAHTFAVRAVDAAGNRGEAASQAFAVDTSAPQTTIDSGPTGPTNDTTPEFGFSSSESGSFQCRVDGGDWQSCTSPHATVPLTDGAHTFEVRAIDSAGNADATPATRSFNLNSGPPETTIGSGPPETTNDATPAFGFASDEPDSTFACRVDEGAWAACSSPHTTASLGDGPHTFEVRATDVAGNPDGTPASSSFTVDTAAPQSTIDSGPSGPTIDPAPTFAFASDDPGASFECRVDGGAWARCSAPHTTAALGDGAHTFEVRAIDAAGNPDATPASRSFTVDTTAPQTTIDAGPDGQTTAITPSFAFSSGEPGTTFECRVDGGAWAPCSSPFTTAQLGAGAHTVEVRAIDGAGNADASPASRTFTVVGPPEGPEGSGTPGDLSVLAGSLVGEGSCQRLGAGLGTRRLRVRGIGTLFVRIRANSLVLADDPLRVSVAGPRGRRPSVRSIGYLLDGRRMTSGRRPPFTLAIKPTSLAKVGRHVLTLRLQPRRGRARTRSLNLRTFGCRTVFRANQRRTRGGSTLRLRVDARDAVSGVTFGAPGRMLPKPAARRGAGRLRVVAAATGVRSWPLAFGGPRFGPLVTPAPAPRVVLGRRSVTVTGLEPATGIVEVTLSTRRATRPRALVTRGRTVRLRARLDGAAPQRLSYKLRGRKR